MPVEVSSNNLESITPEKAESYVNDPSNLNLCGAMKRTERIKPISSKLFKQQP